ncbi:hypothetical protein [Streptomyces sp. NBC_01304]|uniref:hypothetical protein n=1 Tax=Streptomyces sp. NBC_01304 TaxID=2903818 RepID=UPI002E106BAD|nr:hypothetical protein OG430_48515 [Streptomyces sp. NBC_01304]
MDDQYTAVELAAELDHVASMSPEMTGPLAMLDEEALGWTMRYPQFNAPHQAFAQARAQHWPRTRTEDTWLQVTTTARALATALRELGDVQLQRCTEQTAWGPCERVLPEQGPCRGANQHAPSPEGTQ